MAIGFSSRKNAIWTFKLKWNRTLMPARSLSAFQDQIASRETHLKFHRKSAQRRWLLMRVGAQKQFCLHPIKSKLQLVANCIFNCNNYHPLVIANEVTEWLAEWRRWTMQLQLPRTFREARRGGGGGYIISNHPLSRNRSRGWGSALNCNVMARLNEMEMRGRAGQWRMRFCSRPVQRTMEL